MSAAIFIVGSCVSRDALTQAPEGAFTLVDYFARSSIGSAFSAQPVPDTYSARIDSKFQRRQVHNDFAKTLPDSLKKSAFDLLLMDFIDERFPMFRRLDGGIVTLSTELHSLKFLAAEQGELVQPFSDAHFALWEAGWSAFVEHARRHGYLSKIVLTRAWWAGLSDQGRHISELANTGDDQIQQANRHLSRLYMRCARDLFPAQFVYYPAETLVFDPQHRWGPAAFHYAPGFYDVTLAALRKRLPTGADK